MQIALMGAGLLLVGGLFNAVPKFSDKVSEVFGGKKFVQVMIGASSIAMGIYMIVTRS